MIKKTIMSSLSFVRNLFNVDPSLITTGVAVEDNAKADKARKFGKKIDDQQETV